MNEQSAAVTEYLPANAIESVSRAEIDVSISTAQRFRQHSPDKLSQVKTDMMSFATMDVETAQACFYTLPRGGRNIQGPSVRMAEIAVSCYGNVRMGTRILSTVTDGDNPHVVVQAVGHDLEKNIYVSIEKRRRIVKKKSKDQIDEDDINLATNACSAICFRDVAFKIIPQALIKPVYEACRKVAIGDQKTLADRRARCIETFGKMGVQPAKICLKIGKRAVEDITLDDLEVLIGLHNAIKEGEINIDEAFAVEGQQQQPATSTAHSPAPTGLQQAQQAAQAPAQNPPPAAASSPAPKSAAEQAQEVEAKRRGRPPGSKNRIEKFSPKEAAEIRKGGNTVAPSAIAYPEGKSEVDYDANGDLIVIPDQTQRAPAAEPAEAPEAESDLASMGLAPEPEAATPAEPEAEKASEPAAAPIAEPMEFKARAGETPQQSMARAFEYLETLSGAGQVTPAQILGWCKANKLANDGQKITDLATDKLYLICKNWNVLLPKIQAIKA